MVLSYAVNEDDDDGRVKESSSDPITCCYLLLADFPSSPSIASIGSGKELAAALLILDFCPFNHISTGRLEGRRFGWPHYKNFPTGDGYSSRTYAFAIQLPNHPPPSSPTEAP